MFANFLLKSPVLSKKQLYVLLLAPALLVSTPGIGQAIAASCKIKVVGGSYKGRSFPIKMINGRFDGQSGVSRSELQGCRVKKQVYGRWYHLCKKGTLIVYKQKNHKWKRLKPKSLLKYQHNCF